ncbi:MAG: NnrU family protein [Pseudomonadota bacterium]
MAILLLGLAMFFAAHIIPMRTGARAGLIARFGDGGYKGLFSLFAGVGLALIVYGYGVAPKIQVWTPPIGLRHLTLLLMIPSFILLAAAYIPGRIKAAVKHPMLAAIKIWASAHLLANGDVASLILFTAFLAYAVVDRISVKRRGGGAARKPAGPIRNDVIASAVGLGAYGAFALWLHPMLIGVAVLP